MSELASERDLSIIDSDRWEMERWVGGLCSRILRVDGVTGGHEVNG